VQQKVWAKDADATRSVRAMAEEFKYARRVKLLKGTRLVSRHNCGMIPVHETDSDARHPQLYIKLQFMFVNLAFIFNGHRWSQFIGLKTAFHVNFDVRGLHHARDHARLPGRKTLALN
jgi:hypothetical protein